MKCRVGYCTRDVFRVKLGLCENHEKRFLRGSTDIETPTMYEVSDEEWFWMGVNKKGPTVLRTDDPLTSHDESPCWVWTRGVDRVGGYGRYTPRGQKPTKAHRYSLILTGVDVPFDKVVDHLCRNPLCVNPSHLEVVPHKVNQNRGLAGPKTVCKRGHLREASNVSAGSSCKRCSAELAKARYDPDRNRIRRREAIELFKSSPPDDPRHGTEYGYTGLACRCRPCRDAHAKHARDVRAKQKRNNYNGK